MFRRLLVSVLIAALALVVAPRPSFGLGADDHRRCMYRCQERGAGTLQKPAQRGRLDTPIKPLRHNCRWCGPQHGNPDWGAGGRWIGPIWIFVPRHHRPWGGGFHHPDWYDNGDDGWYHRPRPRRWNRWHRGDRWDRGDRRHDRSRSSGYNHHREHPRGRDF